jgi:chromosomal replication initiator protein
VESLFEKILTQLSDELPAEEFQRWLAPIKVVAADDRALVLQVPNIFFKNWINEKYVPRMIFLLNTAVNHDMDIQLQCLQRNDHKIVAGQPYVRPDSSAPYAWERVRINTSLNEKYKFHNFIVGSSNQLAHAASQAVAYRSASYNPLFIYGGSGLGKTHLLNAIGNQLVSQNSNIRVVYVSSEDFTNELIEALRSEGMSAFRQKYRNIDTLLIDDIHFIGGRERTQEEFFYTFNALYEADKQIVLTSDQMPKEIPDLEDRLRSRFEGGLFTDISPPDRETKVAILTRKAEEEGITISNEVAFYLASQNESNIRVLEGYLARLGAYSSLTNNPIDLESAQKLLGLFIEADRKQINLDLIMKVTADFFNIKISDLKSNKKKMAIALPRQAAMYIARQMTGLSTIEIGQRFGGRDHSTVIHAVKRIESRMEKDYSFDRTITELQRTIRSSATHNH